MCNAVPIWPVVQSNVYNIGTYWYRIWSFTVVSQTICIRISTSISTWLWACSVKHTCTSAILKRFVIMSKFNVLLICFIPGAIYLKNLVTQHWADREVESGQPLPFSIHEQDRAMIRDAVVDAVVHAPDLIRYKEGLYKWCQNLVSHLQCMLCRLW